MTILYYFPLWGFRGVSVVKNLPAMQETTYNAEDRGLISWLGSSPEVGNGNPLQYSCMGNLLDRGAWWANGHGVATESNTT